MKKTLLIISLLTIILISGAAKNNQTDSIAAAKQTVQLKELNAKVDSLLKITNELSKERNYFSTALSSQTMIFSIIITITLFLFGLISFASFKIEMKKYKTEIKLIISKQDEKIKSTENINKKLERLTYKSLGNLAILISKYHNNDEATQFKFLLQGARYQSLYEQFEICNENINFALVLIDKEINNPKGIKIVTDENADDLQSLISCQDETVKQSAVKVYAKYLELKEQEPVVDPNPKA